MVYCALFKIHRIKDLINFEMRMEFDSYREEAERRIKYNQDYLKESEEKLEEKTDEVSEDESEN